MSLSVFKWLPVQKRLRPFLFLVTTCAVFVMSLISLGSQAQTNHSAFFSEHQTTLRSLNAPSHLGRGIKTMSVQLPSIYLWAGNSSMDFETFEDFANADSITTEQIDEVIGKLEDNNNAGVGGEVVPFMIAAKIKNDGDELFTFSLGARAKANASLFYSKKLFQLIWKGNKQFAGERVNLGPFSVNAVAYNEYFLGAAVPLPLQLEGIQIRSGFRFSYITSFGTIYTPSSDAMLFTSEDGRQIDLELDYEINTSLPDDFQFQAGSGFGLDLGTTVEIGDQIMGSIALNNIGRIEFTENTDNYFKKGQLRYEGVEAEFIGDAERDDNVEVEADSLEEFFKPDESNRNFKAPLGPELILHGAYRLGKLNGDAEDDLRPSYQHNFYVTYKQGFRHVYDVTKRAEFNVAYMLNLNTILNIGANVGYGGFNAFQAGAFLSIRGGPFVFSLASQNLLGLDSSLGTGYDVSGSFALNF